MRISYFWISVSIRTRRLNPFKPISGAGLKYRTAVGLSGSGNRSYRRPGAACGPEPGALLFSDGYGLTVRLS